MISILHLFWIIPLSAGFGMFITSMCAIAHNNDEEEDE